MSLLGGLRRERNVLLLVSDCSVVVFFGMKLLHILLLLYSLHCLFSCIVKLTYAVLDSYLCIVVSSHATWLHSLRNFSLSYEKEESREMFKKGQMLAVGLRFD